MVGRTSTLLVRVTVHGPGSGTFFGQSARPGEDARAENMYLTPSNLARMLSRGVNGYLVRGGCPTQAGERV